MKKEKLDDFEVAMDAILGTEVVLMIATLLVAIIFLVNVVS